MVVSTFLAACAPSLPPVGASDPESVRSIRPWVTYDGLSEGRRLFAQRCAACHGLPDPAGHPVGEWPALVEWMRSRSRLDTAQGRLVTDWLVARKAQEGR